MKIPTTILLTIITLCEMFYSNGFYSFLLWIGYGIYKSDQ
jgi:hypothetical protein